MGLQLLEREKMVYNEQVREARRRGQSGGESVGDANAYAKREAETQPAFEPDFTGREYLLERQLKPEARKDIIEALAAADILPTAMMDISDGLSSELMHICTQSHTGCRIYEERLPLDYQTAAMAEELNMNVTTCALNGGEDYELVFTVPLTLHDRVSAIPGVKVIGHITKPELGLQLVCRDGVEMELKAQGWNPL
jgi:thiamine-monophosphate kinase